MDGDFPSHYHYTGVCRACAPLGSTPVRGRMEELPGDSIPPVQFILFRPETHCVLVLRTHPVGSVVFSPSMIAGLWANDEPLAHARLGSDYQQASRVR